MPKIRLSGSWIWAPSCGSIGFSSLAPRPPNIPAVVLGGGTVVVGAAVVGAAVVGAVVVGTAVVVSTAVVVGGEGMAETE